MNSTQKRKPQVKRMHRTNFQVVESMLRSLIQIRPKSARNLLKEIEKHDPMNPHPERDTAIAVEGLKHDGSRTFDFCPFCGGVVPADNPDMFFRRVAECGYDEVVPEVYTAS